VLPFWRAVLGYEYRAESTLTSGCRTTRPRPGSRRRSHAGGRLVTDEHAPAWWNLADAEGNEADVATWMGRD
jgi:4a-hydroxytetrahydrobiopterin dehydratase